MKPKLIGMLKRGEITKESASKDIIAGVIVAIIALPLSVALAISSGVSPEKGLITAIIAGCIISLLGGSRVQIGGPTGAFVVIVYGIVQTYGLNGLIIATIMAGIIMILLGLLKFGSVIKYVPYPITVGFTAGIAITLLSTQIKDFFGLNIQSVPSEFIPKWIVYFENLDSINYMALLIGVCSLIIMILWPKINKTIPGSLIALVVTTVIVKIFNLPVATIGSSFESISATIPMPILPSFDLEQIKVLIGPAVTIAILASIESLLSAVVADGMIGGKHDSNMELVAQGIANIFSGLFGGIPATGAIARTAANIKNGGRSPISGIVHAIVLLLIMLIFMPLAKLIPMTTLAAILMIVSYNMGEWRTCISLLKAPKSDMVVLLITFFLTVIFDLVIAIEIGMVLAAFLFMRRIADTTKIKCVKKDILYQGERADNLRKEEDLSNGRVLVYEINGPFFFGIAQKFLEVMKDISYDYDV
ncbi:MAG: SulP family inorganic anion transporter, partial [Clostridium sp.]